MRSEGSDLLHKILQFLETNQEINSLKFSQYVGEQHQKVVGAIKSLESQGNVINVRQRPEKSWVCTEEGLELARDGSHEARLLYALPSGGRAIKEIKSEFPNSAVAIGAAIKNKWVIKSGENLVPTVDNMIDQVQLDLQAITAGNCAKLDDKVKNDYKKRKLIKEIDITVFEVTAGSEFSTSITKHEAELTKEMIESGQWRSTTFKPFNFKSKGKLELRAGYLHPLTQMRTEFRQIFLEMGFSEMPTNSYVESAFWNFDALFQPQQHPARDAHDTFYVAKPARAISVPHEYMEKVRQVHSKGGYGSIGYNYDWNVDEAYKNLLRTHTTAVSARMLQKLALDGFKPVKYFSIDRVYRNETLDATHLAEFHQVEGVVADYNLSIKHLMGIFTAFFEKVGITNLRFKPTYNPYTEPSMEIFSFHPGLKKWVEVGNSGIFRPEMLRPMGLPENVTVIAWGLSLERPAMIKYGINNIRTLVGPKVKLDLIYNNPICTIDKFRKKDIPQSDMTPIEVLTKRQERVLEKLAALQSSVMDVTSKLNVTIPPMVSGHAKLTGQPHAGERLDIVISADPRWPPHSLHLFVPLLGSLYSVATSVHCHSSVKDVPEKLVQFWSSVNSFTSERNESEISLTLVWKKYDSQTTHPPSLCISPLTACQVQGEPNICRYLARLAEVKNGGLALYEMLDASVAAAVDFFLDQCQSQLVLGSSKVRKAFLKALDVQLGQTKYLTGSQLTLADLVILVTLVQLNLTSSTYKNIHRWNALCLEHPWCASLL